MCSRRVCGCRHGRSRSFAFSGLEGGTCRLPALPTRHLPDHLADQPPHPRPPGRPVRWPFLRPVRRLPFLRPVRRLPACRLVLRRPVRRRLPRLLERPLRCLPSAGYAWLRCPATGRPMTARYTAPRARRRARYRCRARVPTGSGEHQKEPSLPVLLSRSARATRPTGQRIPSSRGPGSSPR